MSDIMDNHGNASPAWNTNLRKH